MLVIKECKGYELEKSKPNTSEDFFNKSEVLYEDGGKEKTLEILYLRYFDEIKDQFSPYGEDPVFRAGSREVYFRDVVALACLLVNPEYKDSKKVYINTVEEFSAVFKQLNFDKLAEIFASLESNKKYELRNEREFVLA